jgi:hypothetical protein
MDDKMLLDALFVTIAVLCVPIGYGRGLPRELFVTGGVLLGVTLSNSWARPWGADFADLLNIDVETGQFAVSMMFICGSTILFGFGGAAAAHIETPRRWSRLAGSLLAVCNGALITAFVLRDIVRFLADASTVDRIEESEIGYILLRDFGWVILAAAGLLLVLMLANMAFGDRGTAATPIVSATPEWSQPLAEKPVGRRPRLRWGRDDGKLEPQGRAYDPATERYEADAPNFSETMPVAPVSPTTWSMDRAQGPTTNFDSWVDLRRPDQELGQTEGITPVPVDAMRCQSCGERLGPNESFCPRCGRARS